MGANSYNYGYTGGPGKKDDNEWVSWAVIVGLFALGIWPVGLILLFAKLSDSGSKQKKKDQFPPLGQETPAQTQSRSVWEQAQQAAAQAREQARRTTDQAREEARQTVAQAREQARQTTAQAQTAAAEARERGRAAAARAREKVWQATAETPPTESKARAAAKKMTKTPELKSSTAKWMKAGGTLLAIYGVMGVFQLLDNNFTAILTYNLWEILQFGAFSVAGAGLLLKGLSMDRQAKRFQKYRSVIGNFEAMSIQQLARKLGYSESTVEKDLNKMIDKGFFGPSAYLNMELGYFFRNSEADAKLAREQTSQQPSEPPQEADEGYSGILRAIRRANDRIADPALSSKIQRLEYITAKIFKAVEEDPKKKNRIDTFLNYYLPTTQKLLDSYAEFESTGIEGENLRQAKERIETTMDSIVAGFEHQLDELYRVDALDVDSDIRVMETMLGRDTASAARDFGLGQTPKSKPVTDLDFGGSAAQQQED